MRGRQSWAAVHKRFVRRPRTSFTRHSLTSSLGQQLDLSRFRGKNGRAELEGGLRWPQLVGQKEKMAALKRSKTWLIADGTSGCHFNPACARQPLLQPSLPGGCASLAEWKAQRRYRSSEKGRAARREQSRRRRARQRETTANRRESSARKDARGSSLSRVWGKNFRATGQVAMRASIVRVVLPGSVSVRPYVVRLYVLLVCGRDVGKMSASGCPLNALESCITRVRGP